MKSRVTVLIIAILFISSLLAACLFYVFFTTAGVTFAASVFGRYVPVDIITVEKISGNLAAGALLQNVTVAGIAGAAGVGRIQELRVVIGRGWRLDIAVKNGRFDFASGGLVSFAGNYTAGRVEGNVYSAGLSLQTLVKDIEVLKNSSFAGFHARFSAVDLYCSGRYREKLLVQGKAVLDEIAFRHFSAAGCPLSLDLYIVPGYPLRLSGTILTKSGEIVSQYTALKIQEAMVTFSGDPADPGVRMLARTVIADTSISASLSGKISRPEFLLSSQPSLPQERLLVMLLTGKSWEGTEASLQQGQLTPDLVKDFTDFFLFGTSGKSLENRLGISDIELIYEKDEKGIEVHKSLGTKADVIYGVTRSSEQEAQGLNSTRIEQTVGLEYKLTDAVSVEGTRRAKAPPQALSGENSESAIKLKFKKRF